jgi:hypothetical protein
MPPVNLTSVMIGMCIRPRVSPRLNAVLGRKWDDGRAQPLPSLVSLGYGCVQFFIIHSRWPGMRCSAPRCRFRLSKRLSMLKSLRGTHITYRSRTCVQMKAAVCPPFFLVKIVDTESFVLIIIASTLHKVDQRIVSGPVRPHQLRRRHEILLRVHIRPLYCYWCSRLIVL